MAGALFDLTENNRKQILIRRTSKFIGTSVLVTGLLTAAGIAAAQTSPLGKSPGGASATSTTPDKAGEASTTVRGNPNANPDDPRVTKSSAERKSERDMKRADRKAARESRMGNRAAAGDASPNVPAGTPATNMGGTPK